MIFILYQLQMGWLIGYDNINKEGFVLNYKDGSWTKVSMPYSSNDYTYENIYMIDANNGWITGYNRDSDDTKNTVLLVKYESGKWTMVTPPDVGSTSWWLNDISFKDKNNGIAVGIDNTNPENAWAVIIKYTNGKWEKITPPLAGTNWFLNYIKIFDLNNIWTIGKTNQHPKEPIFCHYNGTEWKAKENPSVSFDWQLNDIKFLGKTDGWSVGYDKNNRIGTILHFKETYWERVMQPDIKNSEDWMLTKTDFSSSSNGIAIGWSGEGYTGPIILTYNSEWKQSDIPQLSSSEAWIPYDVKLIDNSNGWIVGAIETKVKSYKPLILKYTSGNWTQVEAPYPEYEWKIHRIYSIEKSIYAIGWDIAEQRNILIKYSK